MRNLAIILAILAQAAALAWVVFERETVLHNGTVVYLRTAPVDPRDMLRGDYVQLSYDINRVPSALADAELLEQTQRADVRVYASLSVDANGVARIMALHTQAPDGLYLRGYTSHDWQLQGNNREVAVKFGIEKLFVEQGAGLLIEKRRGSRDGWQTPMEVEVAVGTNGIGVIRNYRWATFATRLEVLNPPQQGERTSQHSPRLRFSIRNDAQTSMVLVNPGDDCGFDLLPVSGQAFTLRNNVCAGVVASSADRAVLNRGEVYAEDFDMAQARWHIRITEDGNNIFSGEMNKYNAWQRYRLQYSSPTNAAALSQNGESVWIGTINSAAFGNGRVD